MALPPSQQHALNAIDNVLQSAEPRLATMFGVFTDLTRLEAMPPAETLPPGPWWTRHRLPGHRFRAGRYRTSRNGTSRNGVSRNGVSRFGGGRPGRPGSERWPARQAGGQVGRIVLIPLLLLAAASLLVVSLVSSGAAGRRGCGQGVAAAMVPALRIASSAVPGSGGAGCPARSPQPTAGSR